MDLSFRFFKENEKGGNPFETSYSRNLEAPALALKGQVQIHSLQSEKKD